jgi:sarcosine oxidase subunit delta
MLLIRCPYCEEERPELEFRNAGEAHIARSTNIAALSDEDFEKFFFIRSNPKGIAFERWRHVHGCARFFNAVRDTVTDKFVMTYKAGEPKPDLTKIMKSETPAAETVPDDAQEDKAKKPAAKKATAKQGDA